MLPDPAHAPPPLTVTTGQRHPDKVATRRWTTESFLCTTRHEGQETEVQAEWKWTANDKRNETKQVAKGCCGEAGGTVGVAQAGADTGEVVVVGVASSDICCY
ncbi:hypothetical protein ACLKA7_006899 [Drosophila subpalustris]